MMDSEEAFLQSSVISISSSSSYSFRSFSRERESSPPKQYEIDTYNERNESHELKLISEWTILIQDGIGMHAFRVFVTPFVKFFLRINE